VVFRVASRFGQLFDHDILRRIGRIAHAKVDHVLARSPFVVQKFVDPREQVQRQPVYALGYLDFERLILGAGIVGIWTLAHCSA